MKHNFIYNLRSAKKKKECHITDPFTDTSAALKRTDRIKPSDLYFKESDFSRKNISQK